MNQQLATVLLTGGAGFIGSHLAEGYCANNYNVIIVDNLSSGTLENIQHLLDKGEVTFCNVDIRDKERLESVFEEYKPDIINHHAAQKSVPYSVTNPRYDIEINLLGFLNLLQCAKKYNVKHFIGVSSGGALSKMIIGDEKSKETDMPQLFSPYAIDKFASEKYLELYSKEFDFEFSILRYANVYGPRQIADGECGVVPIFLNNVIANKKSILMTYPDMPRGCTRDYVYIEDIVTANLMVTKKPINTVVNIASGEELAMMDIYEAILKVYNSNLEIEVQGPRSGDVKRSVLDAEKAKELMGWHPTTSLIEGLEKLKRYMDKNI